MWKARLFPVVSIVAVIAVGMLAVQNLKAFGLAAWAEEPLETQLAQTETAPKAKTKLLLEQKLKGLPGYKVQIVFIDGPPGWVGSKHYHPGHLFGYVFEGTYHVNFADMTSRTIKAGEVFYENPNSVMRSKNASLTEGTKEIVFQVLPEDQPGAISVE